LFLPLASFLLSASPVRVELVDSTDRAGFEVVTTSGGPEKNHILESTGNGVLLLDYDGDGFLDVYFVNAQRFLVGDRAEPHSNVLYRNLGNGTFQNVTREAGVGSEAFGAGGAVVDFDNDGLPDLYVTNWGPNVLFRNRGDGTFEDVTARAGVGDPRWSLGATFLDADGDGDADLYVANYIETTWEQVWSARRIRLWRGKVDVLDGPRGLKGSRNTFYRNNGNGTFEEATEAAGLTDGAELYSMGVESFDYDNDGDVDIYVANDSTPNALYRNRGDGTFEEVAALAGCAYNADGSGQGSMGVDFGDFDGDGLFDLIVTNFAHDYDTLYRNLGGGLFVDYSFVANLAVPSFAPLGWGTHFLDVDRDGDLDLFASSGHIYPQVEDDETLHESYKQRNLLLLNQGGKLEDATAASGSGLAVVESSRGSAAGDLDNDGDLDIVVSNQDARPTYLENRTEGAGHWVEIELIDTVGTRQALGARIEVEASGKKQIRQVSSGGSYASQNDSRLHVGLGPSAALETLVVTWLDGTRETYTGLPADRWYRLRRGGEPRAMASGGAH
jgi:enediyne biosynthesis protein E4